MSRPLTRRSRLVATPATLPFARLAILLLCLISPAAAQRYSFASYGNRDDLSITIVRCLLQDRAGFLWIGTSNGLFRYDGVRFARYGVNEGLPTNRVNALHQTRDNRRDH
jgi:ligand-binding sensor domain-containing protein